MSNQPNYQSFLLRLWRQPDGAYCASLHCVQGDERHVFADLEALIRYLRALKDNPCTGIDVAPATRRKTDNLRIPG